MVSLLNSMGLELCSEKFVLVRTQVAVLKSHKTQYLLYPKEKKQEDVNLASTEDLDQEVEAADPIHTCCGAGLLQEFLPLEVQPSSTVKIWDNQLITQKCAMTVESAG